jgi:D-lactate dehydrogenase (cytochrome)
MIAMSLRSLPRASLTRKTYTGGIALRGRIGVNAQVGRLTQKRWASDDKKGADGEKPFYFQLQESIFERVQKEKAEQIRIQSLQQRTARGQFWATVTGPYTSSTLHQTAY